METTQCNNLDTTELDGLTKSQLIELLVYSDALAKLKGRRVKGATQISIFIDIMRKGPITIDEVATRMNITNKNVSTLKSNSGKNGFGFGKNAAGQIFIEYEPAV